MAGLAEKYLRPETIRQVDRIVRLGGHLEEPSRRAEPQPG